MNLGEAGQIVNVKPGYARNFLIPQKIASTATKQNLKMLDDRKHKLEAKKLDQRADAEKIQEKLASSDVKIKVRCSEEGKLYGSITAREIQAELEASGIKLDKKQIILAKPIKTIGTYEALVRLVGGIELMVPLKVWTDSPLRVKMEEEAKAEAEAAELEHKKADEKLAEEAKKEDETKAEA